MSVFFHVQAATWLQPPAGHKGLSKEQKAPIFFSIASKERPLPSAKVQCGCYALDPPEKKEKKKGSKYSTETFFVRSPAREKCCGATRVSKLPPIGRFAPCGILGTAKPSELSKCVYFCEPESHKAGIHSNPSFLAQNQQYYEHPRAAVNKGFFYRQESVIQSGSRPQEKGKSPR